MKKPIKYGNYPLTTLNTPGIVIEKLNETKGEKYDDKNK